MHHHDVPPLISIVLPPVPFELLKSLLSVVDTNGEVVQGLAMAVVEFVNPLDTALQILDSLLNLDDGNVKGAMVNSLILKRQVRTVQWRMAARGTSGHARVAVM